VYQLLLKGKSKGSPYSITERRVLELSPVLGSQPAGDVSHKPGGRLPLERVFSVVTYNVQQFYCLLLSADDIDMFVDFICISRYE